MTTRQAFLARLAGQSSETGPFFVPDLTLWYAWHKKQGSLPQKWAGYNLPQIARELGLPIWQPVRPWRVDTPEISVTTTTQNNERVMRVEAASGLLTARWIVGPDGDWWQTDYLVKSEADFPAALELARARTYTLDPACVAQAETRVGDGGLVVLELPRRGYADILHDFLGWSEGLMLMDHPQVHNLNAILDAKLQALAAEVARLPGLAALSPDNLDGQFIPPRTFDAFLAGSYRQTAELLHQHGQLLVVHVGGPVKHLLPKLAHAGVDCVEGLAGPPQGDLPPAEARAVAGPDITLWGGIPQDFLLDTYKQPDFEAAVRQIARESADDPRFILGVADRVPVEANLDRLQQIPHLLQN